MLKKLNLSNKIIKLKLLRFSNLNFSSSNLIQTLEDKINTLPNYNPIDTEEVSQLYKDTKFKLKESDNSHRLILHKKEHNLETKINFNARAPLNEKLSQLGIINIILSLESLNNIIDISIIIKKQDDKKGILVDSLLVGNNLEISNIQYSEDVDFVYKNHFINQKYADLYTGPNFLYLNKNLQKELHSFIDSLIDIKVIEFINRVSVNKEERLFRQWLNKVKYFVGFK